jgi:hypothetical protein
MGSLNHQRFEVPKGKLPNSKKKLKLTSSEQDRLDAVTNAFLGKKKDN